MVQHNWYILICGTVAPFQYKDYLSSCQDSYYKYNMVIYKTDNLVLFSNLQIEMDVAYCYLTAHPHDTNKRQKRVSGQSQRKHYKWPLAQIMIYSWAPLWILYLYNTWSMQWIRWSWHELIKTKYIGTKHLHDNYLTHWGRVTCICVRNLTIFDLDKGLSLGWRQVIIIWTNVRIVLIGPLETKLKEI